MNYFYIAIFGALGGLMRYCISIVFNAESFPYNTLLINIIGSFLLAFIIRYLSTWPKLSRSLINGLSVGLIGSFTTFSTFSVETSQLIISNEYLLAVSYVLSSLFGGFLSAGLGFYVGEKLIARKELNEIDN